MRLSIILFCCCSQLLAVKFVKDVLPAVGAITTITVNANTLIEVVKHPKVTVKKIVKKIVKK